MTHSHLREGDTATCFKSDCGEPLAPDHGTLCVEHAASARLMAADLIPEPGSAADQAIAAERDRQLREGIGCLVCDTRYHASTCNLDGGCPVCEARRLENKWHQQWVKAHNRMDRLLIERNRFHEALDWVLHYEDETAEETVANLKAKARRALEGKS